MYVRKPLRCPYVVIEIADQLEVPVGSLSEDDAVSLLGHEEAERETQVGLQQSFAQTVRRLLGVPHLAKVGSL